MTQIEYISNLNNEELEKKFSKIKPLFNQTEAMVESSRCLFCHDAPCIKACPTSIDVPMFIRQIMSRNTQGAAKTIFKQNILGKSCGDVCPTQVLCEGACVYNNLNEKPIEIGRLQAYATNYAIENNIRFFKKGKSTGKKVAVIGGGPAGLACAHELSVLGHEVIVFESNPKAGGLNMYGVAPYKFSNEDAKKEIKYISDIGFEIKTNTRVVIKKDPRLTYNQVPISELESKFDAIYIGVGLGKSKKLGLPGESLREIYGAAEFIHSFREKEQKIKIGGKVIVIGGGNTAIDAAVESSLLGADVTAIYRRSEKEQSAYSFEIEHAKKHGVKFVYLTSPVEIIGNGNVEKIKFIKNKLEKTNEKVSIKQIPNSEFVLPCDTLIFATGQEKILDLLSHIPNLTLSEGKVVVNENCQTSNPKYFAGGDCINGGKEVVHAVCDGREAARGIDKYLKEVYCHPERSEG